MAIDKQIYLGDSQTEIILNVGIADTEIQDAFIDYTKPDGTTGTWTAQPVPASETISFITGPGDIDQTGLWLIQSFIRLNSGWEGHGEKEYLRVNDVLLGSHNH